ncbi:hypothetical protein B0H21DRAFT_709408 [Amylocystis lapponica]|nr:hypothetical protein B0H21DRAFT_709408 [Amylocystis lapponica]
MPDRQPSNEFPFPPMDAVEPTSSPSDTPPSRTRSSLSRSPRSPLSPPPRHTRTRGDRDRDRDREPSGTRSKLLSRLISHEERESTHVRTLLVLTTDRLENETRRADDAERRVVEVLHKLRAAHEATMLAQADAARANEELRMYRYRLEDAQREITRAQDILNDIEQQKADAEAEAARARSTARRFREERLMAQAREEGRRQGFKEGLSRGKDVGYYEASSGAQGDARYGRRPILVEQMSDEEEDGDGEGPGSPVVVAPIPRSPIRADWRPSSRATASRAVRRSPDSQGDPIAIPRSPIRIRSPRHGPRPQPDAAAVAGPSNSQLHDDDPIVPVPIYNHSPSPSRPPVTPLPDDFIPLKNNDDGKLPVPPAFQIPGSMSPNHAVLAPQASQDAYTRPRDYAAEPPNVARPGPAAQMSPSSRTSTNISQYDLVSSRAGTSASGRFMSTVGGTLASIIGSPSGLRPKTPAGSARSDRHTASRGRSRRKQDTSAQVEDSPAAAGPAAEREHRARSPLEFLFKKAFRSRMSPSSSAEVPEIVVVSPTTKSSRPSTMTNANEPNLLSPEVSYTPLAEPQDVQAETSAEQRPLPELPGLGLTTPGTMPVADGQLPPGFVPYGAPPFPAMEEIPSFAGDYERGANTSPHRSVSSPKPGPQYAVAPIPPNIVYPDPPGRKATPRGPDGVAFPLSPPPTSPAGSRRGGSFADALSPLSLRLSSPLR